MADPTRKFDVHVIPDIKDPYNKSHVIVQDSATGLWVATYHSGLGTIKDDDLLLDDWILDTNYGEALTCTTWRNLP